MTDRDKSAQESTPDAARDDAEAHREKYELQQLLLEADKGAEEAERHAHQMRQAFDAHEAVIARKVKQLRLERNWSQAAVANLMEDVGFPMHQTTVAKIEAGNRPLQVAETFALSSVFGLSPLALWYLPVPSEPTSFATMRDDLKRTDDTIKAVEENLSEQIKQYAYWTEHRAFLAWEMNNAAARYASLTERHAALLAKREHLEGDLHALEATQMDARSNQSCTEAELNDISLRASNTRAEIERVVAEAWRIKAELDAYGDPHNQEDGDDE